MLVNRQYSKKGKSVGGHRGGKYTAGLPVRLYSICAQLSVHDRLWTANGCVIGRGGR